MHLNIYLTKDFPDSYENIHKLFNQFIINSNKFDLDLSQEKIEHIIIICTFYEKTQIRVFCEITIPNLQIDQVCFCLYISSMHKQKQ